jgi:hypothetical protein
MKWDSSTYSITDRGRFHKLTGLIGLIGLVACVIALFVDREQLFYSWLTAFMFWFTLAAGGLFFVMLQHLVGATWSVVIRRMAETVMSVLPYMAIAFLPLIFGIHELYHWSHADAVAQDELLQWKSGYLNFQFFIIRAIIYFGVWTLLTVLLRKASFIQDKGHTPQLASRFTKISAPGMIAFALTMTLAAFDWLMSLDPHWYSTIFGAYIFAGSAVAILAFLPLTAICMRRRGVMAEMITVEHYHDMGKLLFAFLVFWAYMAFSQYFLIWYGNIPEETIWFLHRWEGSWKTVTLFLVFGHFVGPFFILITRGAKRNLTMLKVFAIWMLFMHWIDLHWIVMPTIHHHGIHLSWIDLAAMMAVGGAFLSRFWYSLTSHPLVPLGDPKLEKSIKFINH